LKALANNSPYDSRLSNSKQEKICHGAKQEEITMKNMKLFRPIIVMLVAALSLSFAACSKGSKKPVTLAGSTAFQPFAEKLAEKYMSTNKDVQINVQGGGSAVGIQSTISGAADIGMADLLELPPEAKDLAATVVARDGIAIIVNPINGVTSITKAQAHDIFAGKISNWKDLGGMDAAISVISREEGSGTRRSFDKMVLKGDALSPTALFQNSNGTIREAVASDPNAIGYVSIGLVNDKVKPLSFDNVTPTNDNVKAGTYPLARPVFFLTKGEAKDHVKMFLDFVMSPESQKTLETEGLIAAK
jgi:phosphate transport system substrate-binding protein